MWFYQFFLLICDLLWRSPSSLEIQQVGVKLEAILGCVNHSQAIVFSLPNARGQLAVSVFLF